MEVCDAWKELSFGSRAKELVDGPWRPAEGGGDVFGVFAERICALLGRGSRCGFDDVQTGTVDKAHLRERRRPDSCLSPESEPSSRLSEREEAAQDMVAYVVELGICITGLYTRQDEP